VRGGEWTGL